MCGFFGSFSSCIVLKLGNYMLKVLKVLLTDVTILKHIYCKAESQHFNLQLSFHFKSTVLLLGTIATLTNPAVETDCNKPHIFTPVIILDRRYSWVLHLKQWFRMADGYYTLIWKPSVAYSVIHLRGFQTSYRGKSSYTSQTGIKECAVMFRVKTSCYKWNAKSSAFSIP